VRQQVEQMRPFLFLRLAQRERQKHPSTSPTKAVLYA
jgi:hypothetical protein